MPNENRALSVNNTQQVAMVVCTYYILSISLVSFLKEICLSPGHDRVVTIKSWNFFYCESLVLSGVETTVLCGVRESNP